MTAGRTSGPYRVGYAPGAYDLFHIGHLNILRHARAQCDYLVAGVVSDEMAEQAKGRRPVIPLVERLEIVRSVRYVDAAFVETVPDKLATWKQVRFDVLFKGDDWRGTPKGDKLERDFATVGVRVVYFPYTVHTSSTQLRRALDALGGGRAVPAGPVGGLAAEPALGEPAVIGEPAVAGSREPQFSGELHSVPGTTS